MNLEAPNGVSPEPAAPPLFRTFRTVGADLLLAVLFAVAHTQALLYYSNQNQYFLHGLAQAGYGSLADDWLANTADPAPVFSGLVWLTYRTVGPVGFYVEYGLLQAVYFLSLLSVAAAVVPELRKPLPRFCFSTLLIFVNSGLAGWLSSYYLGSDYFWYAQAGFAGQYVLGAILQPSSIGVLLLVSVALFVAERPLSAAVVAALAAVCHSTYLLSAAILTLTYLAPSLAQGRLQRAVRVGAVALILVLPVVVYNLVVFGPTTPEEFHDAQYLLVHSRIPHHAMPLLWFNASSVAQLLGLALAAWWSRDSKLGLVFAVSLPIVSVLTVVQIQTESDTLALLFPWRLSVCLVPLATAVLLAQATVWLTALVQPESAPGRRVVRMVLATLMLLASTGLLVRLAVSGVVMTEDHVGYGLPTAELPVMDFARSHPETGRVVYLLPLVLDSDISKNTSNIAAVRRVDPSGRAVGGFDKFRLRTGWPVFIDVKSPPYKDVEVLEWNRRVDLVVRAYEELRRDPSRIEKLCRDEGVTHVVTFAEQHLPSGPFVEIYHDDRYRIYEFLRPQ